jgi:predicted nucleotidyltransferase
MPPNAKSLYPHTSLRAARRNEPAYLFGSVAGEMATHLSDIDIAVYLTDNDVADKRLEILVDLIDILKSDNVDLVILNTAPLSLKMKIIQTKKILAENKPNLRHDFESRTLRSYFDFSKLEKRILENRYLRG